MIKGNTNGALQLLSNNMHNVILPLTKETLELLVQKHLEPRKLSPVYDDMGESIMLAKFESGPSDFDAGGWSRILTFSAFGIATVHLHKTFP